MPIRMKMAGTGLTQRETLWIEGRADWADWAEFLKARKGRNDLDLDRYLAEIEAQAIATLTKAGLPTTRGFHERQPDGTWRSVTMEEVIQAADKPAKPGVPLYEGSPFMDAMRIIDEMGFEPDSREGYAVRVVSRIANLRRWRDDIRKRGLSTEALRRWSDGIAMEALKLGVLLKEGQLKDAWEKDALRGRSQMRSAGRPPKDTMKRDVALARKFLKRKAKVRKNGGTGSETCIKEMIVKEIGKRSPKSIKRTATIEAINRGLKILSAE